MRFEKRPAKTYSIRRRHNIGSRPNIHRELELAYMLSGQATVHVQGKEYPVSAGALALVFPNQAHFYTNDTENDNILLLCSPDEFPEFHAAFFQQLPLCPVVTPPAGLVVPLLERMLSLSEEGIGEDVFRQGQMRGYAMAHVTCPEPSTAITNKKAFLASAGVFLLAVVLLITHAQTELSVACIGVIVAILTLIVLGLTSGKKSVIEIIKGVDYKTLLFFIGLFVSVAGLEKTGVLNMIANFITSVSEGNIAVIVIVILWLSAITSAFVDNIPFAATMIPVIRAIAATEGMDIGVLAWALSLGTDLGGNATPIGASANVVGTSASAKGGYPIGWGRYCKYCVPATIIVMAVSTAYLFLRYL